MNKAIITEQFLFDIGNSIREKTGDSNSYKPSEMASAIMRIRTQGNIISKRITENGIYNCESEGVDGYNIVDVDVEQSNDNYDLLLRNKTGTFVDNTITGINSYVFYKNINIEGAFCENAKVIKAHAFYNCINLKQISFPNCEEIWSHAFDFCYNSLFSTLFLPKCRTI